MLVQSPPQTASIHSIEFARRAAVGEYLCLCLRLDPNVAAIWRAFELQGATVSVVLPQVFQNDALKGINSLTD